MAHRWSSDDSSATALLLDQVGEGRISQGLGIDFDPKVW